MISNEIEPSKTNKKEKKKEPTKKKEKKKKPTIYNTRPPTARIPEPGVYFPQNIKDELWEEEWEMFQEVKKHEVSKSFSDKFIMACLFSRKLNVKRTIAMLKGNLKWRSENKFEKIEWEDINKKLLLQDFGSRVPGTRSKDGCGILYAKVANMLEDPEVSEDYTKEMVDLSVWNSASGNMFEDLDFHRNGLIFIFDLHGVGWKNINLSLQKHINSALMDNFPMKVTRVLILNPPMILGALVNGVRLFVKRKIIDRIKIVEMDELLEYVDPEQLHIDFGGKVNYPPEAFVHFVDKIIQTDYKEVVRSYPYEGQTLRKAFSRDGVPHLKLPEDDKKTILIESNKKIASKSYTSRV